MQKLQEIYCEYTLIVSEKLVYSINDSLKRIISAKNAFTKYRALLLWQIIDCSNILHMLPM